MLYPATLQPLDEGTSPMLALPTDRVIRWARLDPSDSDSVAEAIDLTCMVMNIVEKACQQPVFLKTYKTTLAVFANGRLPFTNNVKVTGITYRTTTGVSPVALATTDYSLIDNELAFGSPLYAVSGVSAVEITFTAGYAPEELPGGIRMAMLRILVDSYEFRHDPKRSEPSVSDKLIEGYVKHTV